MSQNRRVIPNALLFASVEEIIAEGKSVDITVKGFSMRPFLRDGRDAVTISPIGAEELRVGMVVLFRYRNAHVLHRIRAIRDGRLTIEGDGNYRLCEEAAVEDVVGYVSSVTLGGGATLSYGSARWRCRSVWSLAVKRVRTLAIWLKHKILGK